MFSSFLTDLPSSVPTHALTAEQAVSIALASSAPGAVPAGEEEFATAIPTFDRIDGELRPLYRVGISLDSPFVNQTILLDGITGTILDVGEEADSTHEGPLVCPLGLPGRVFPVMPPYGATNPAAFVSELRDVELPCVRPVVEAPDRK